MKKYHLLTLFLVFSATIHAQKLFYTTYQDSISYLHVKDLNISKIDSNIYSFFNDSIKQIVVNREDIYLVGKDSLYMLSYNSLNNFNIKKAIYVENIEKIYVSDSMIHVTSNLNNIYDSENFSFSTDFLKKGVDIKYPEVLFSSNKLSIEFVFLNDLNSIGLVFLPGAQKNEDTYIFYKFIREERDFLQGIRTYSDLIGQWHIFYFWEETMYSFATINDSTYYSIRGKTRLENHIFEEVYLQKSINTNSMYSTPLPKNIGAIVPNFNSGIENNILYSLSESNVLYKITDNEALQEFEIDSLATFSTPILSLISSNDDRLFMLKKDTIFDLNSEIVVQKNISAFTLQDKSVITGLEKTKDINEIATFSIYPNPNEGIFSLDIPFNEDEINKIQVYDNVGNLILETTPSDQNEINMTNSKKGIYFVTLVLNNKVLTQKIILN